MIEEPSKKDTIYLKNVEKIGNSIENIIYIENVLSIEEHQRLLDYTKSRDSWVKQPWDAQTIQTDEFDSNTFLALQKVFTFVHNKTTSLYDVDIDFFKIGGIPLIKFESGFRLDPHVDTLSNELNHIASIYYINDDYEGGEINFTNHKLKIKPKANSLIIFPGNENYPHEVAEVLVGNRYTSSVWFQFTGSTFNKKKEWYN
jgi:hypothetical protein